MWVEFFDVEGVDEVKAAAVIEVGHRHVDELMSWLGWSLWVRCEPACGLGVRHKDPPKFLTRMLTEGFSWG